VWAYRLVQITEKSGPFVQKWKNKLDFPIFFGVLNFSLCHPKATIFRRTRFKASDGGRKLYPEAGSEISFDPACGKGLEAPDDGGHRGPGLMFNLR